MKRKGIALFASLMIALMLTGAAFALWSEVLVIEGTVDTGTVDVELIAGNSWDTEEDYPPEKDVSFIECWVDNGVLVVYVFNAYPCIDYYQDFSVHCIGTVPVDLAAIKYTDDFPADATVEIMGFAVGDQLHECNSRFGSIHIHLGNDALQGHTYTFTMEMDWHQYNE